MILHLMLLSLEDVFVIQVVEDLTVVLLNVQVVLILWEVKDQKVVALAQEEDCAKKVYATAFLDSLEHHVISNVPTLHNWSLEQRTRRGEQLKNKTKQTVQKGKIANRKFRKM